MAKIIALLNGILSRVPEQLDFEAIVVSLFVYIGCTLILGLLGRTLFKKGSGLSQALSSVMAILFIYVTTIIIYTFKPWNLKAFLSPLPFVSLTPGHLYCLPFLEMPLDMLCGEIMGLFILAFLVNFLDVVLPKGEKAINWLLYRLLTIMLAMAMHLMIRLFMDLYLPDVLIRYGAPILLGLLLVLIGMGFISIIIGYSLAAGNPIIGGLYAFFFQNLIGKQMSKAALTTLMLCILFFLMNHFGLNSLDITATTLMTYIPGGLGVLGLWFILGRFL